MLPPCLANFIDEWKRPEVLINNNPNVPMLELETTEVDGKQVQGGEGGRQAKGELFAGNDKAFEWLLAVMQAVKQRSGSIRQGDFLWELIYPKDKASGLPTISPSGKYIVRCFVMNEWRQVVVDDRIPVDLFGRPLPVGVRPVQLWPLLLSKAVLKIMAALTILESTSPLEAPAFHWLTGWPTESLVSAGMDRGHPRRSFDLEDGRLFDRIEEVQGDLGALVSCCLIERAASDRPPPRMLVLCGPDAVGLEDIMGKMLEDFAEAFGRTVSHTTRPPLEHEVDGDTYHFTDRPTMESDIEQGLFLESSEMEKYSKGIPGRYLYGTSLATVREVAATGRLCIMDIDVKGCQALYDREGVDAMYVYLRAPSHEELERRQRARLKEAESTIQKRLSHAQNQIEQSREEGLFNNIIVNDQYDDVYLSVKEAIAVLSPIIRNRLRGLPAYVLDYSDIIPANSVEKPNVKPVALVGPTTTEKDQLIANIVEEFPDVFGFARQHTTRVLEEGEEDRFIHVSKEEFQELMDGNKFVEHREDLFVHPSAVQNHGTSYDEVSVVTQQSRLCLLNVDVEGVKQMRSNNVDHLSIFLDPPSMETFEKRLRDWLAEPDTAIEKMLAYAKAQEESARQRGIFDAIITYNDVEHTFDGVKEVVSKFRPDVIPPLKSAGAGGRWQAPLVIGGPTAVGKTTLVKKLLEEFPDKFEFCVSHTTRPPRDGEEEGKDYFFTDRATFEADVAEGKFLEHTEINGHLYGTSLAAVKTEPGSMCILDIDTAGAAEIRNSKGQLRAWVSDMLNVAIHPPSKEVLEERVRSIEGLGEEEMEARVAQALAEMDKLEEESKSFDNVVVINDDLEKSYIELKDAIAAHSPDIMKPAPKPLVLVGPMGSGKSSLMNRIMREHSGNFASPVFHTTRPKREGEVQGQSFHFVEKSEMDAGVADGDFWFVEEALGHLYGVSKREMWEVAHRGTIGVLSVDSVADVKKLHGQGMRGTFVFVQPESMEAMQKRLEAEVQRACPPGYEPEEVVALRMTHIKSEMEAAAAEKFFNFVVNNDGSDAAYCQLMEAVSQHAPDVVPLYEVWGYGQGLWDKTVRTYGRPIVRISIIGPAASGKSTQAKLLEHRFGVPYLYPGELVYKEVQGKTKLGLEAKPYLDNTKTVPEELIARIIKKRIAEEDCQMRGWMLDGFPHTLKECEALKNAGIFPDKVIFLESKHDELFERIKGRKINPANGEVFYIAPEGSDRPSIQPEGKDDEETEEIIKQLTIRHDDTEDNVRNRLFHYDRLDQNLRSEFRNVSTYINAERDKEAIFHDIEAFITLEVRLKDSIVVTPTRSLREFTYIVDGTLKHQRRCLLRLRQDTGPEVGEHFWVDVMDLGTNTQCVLLGVNQEGFGCTRAQNKLDFSSMPASEVFYVDSPEPIDLFTSLSVGTQYFLEDVLRPPQRAKVVVLTGPVGVGVDVMESMLVNDYSDRCRSPPVDSASASDDIATSAFRQAVEAGEYILHALGTSGKWSGVKVSEVESIVSSGKICVLDAKFDQLAGLRGRTDFDFVFMYIKPKSIEALDNRLRGVGGYAEEELQQHLRAAEHQLEELSEGPAGEQKSLFHHIITNDVEAGCYNRIKVCLGPHWPMVLKPTENSLILQEYDWKARVPGKTVLRLSNFTHSTARLRLPRGKHMFKLNIDQGLLYSAILRSNTEFTLSDKFKVIKEVNKAEVHEESGTYKDAEAKVFSQIFRHLLSVTEPTEMTATMFVADSVARKYMQLHVVNNDTGDCSTFLTDTVTPCSFAPNESGYTVFSTAYSLAPYTSGPWRFVTAASCPASTTVLQMKEESYNGMYEPNKDGLICSHVLHVQKKMVMSLHLETSAVAAFQVSLLEVEDGKIFTMKQSWHGTSVWTCTSLMLEPPPENKQYIMHVELDGALCDFVVAPNGDIPHDLEWKLAIHHADPDFRIEADETRDNTLKKTLAAWNESGSGGSSGRPAKASEVMQAYQKKEEGVPGRRVVPGEETEFELNPERHLKVVTAMTLDPANRLVLTNEDYNQGLKQVEKSVEEFQKWKKTREEGFEEADANREVVGGKKHADLASWREEMLTKRQATQSRRQAYLASKKAPEQASSEDSAGEKENIEGTMNNAS